MRIVFISDTHNQLHKMQIPAGDILIHSGDATNRGTVPEIEQFEEALAKLPHKTKIFIPGNHDWLFQRNEETARKLLPSAIVLIDQLVEVDGLKIYGAPWQPEFCNWAFNVRRGKDLAEIWAKIPDNTDILVTHGPAYGVLDYVHAQTRLLTINHLGCEDLFNRIKQIQPKIHSFGHIHDTYGRQEYEWSNKKTTTFVNASSCNEQYYPVNKPIVIDIE